MDDPWRIIMVALVKTPLDFASFIVKGFSANELSKSKNLSDKVNLITTSINFSEAFGFSNDSLKKIGDQCKSFKNVFSTINFVPNMTEEIRKLGVVNPVNNIFNSYLYGLCINVAKLAKNFFSGFVSFVKFLDKSSFGISSTILKTFTSAGNIFGAITSTTELAEGANKLARVVSSPVDNHRHLRIKSAVFGVFQKISLLALAVLSLTTVVAMPPVAPIVIPSLGMAQTVFGLCGKYCDSYIP